MFKALKAWWDNTKNVVLDFVFPQLDKLKPAAVEALNNLDTMTGKTNKEKVDFLFDKIIKEYLKRQI